MKALAGTVAVAAILVLAGCETRGQEQDYEQMLRDRGFTQLSGPEITAALTGNTARMEEPGWVWFGYYAASGVVTGRSVTDGGIKEGRGRWEVNGEGLLCRDWENDWGGGYGCRAIYRKDEMYAYAHRYGSAGAYPNHEFIILPGNPEGL